MVGNKVKQSTKDTSVRFLLLLYIAVNVLYANNGEKVYEKKCASCHIKFIPLQKVKQNFLDANNTLLKLAAPTFNQISYQLKKSIGNQKADEDIHRLEVVAFILDYVLHPHKNKSMCIDETLKYFSTMPSLDGKITENELEAVSNYLYDVYQQDTNIKGKIDILFQHTKMKAQKENKIVMLKVMTPECRFCRKMQKGTLQKSEVVEALKKSFITMEVDISKYALPLGLKTTLTPSFIFIDQDEKVIMNIPGAWNKEDFLEILREAKLRNEVHIK